MNCDAIKRKLVKLMLKIKGKNPYFFHKKFFPKQNCI